MTAMDSRPHPSGAASRSLLGSRNQANKATSFGPSARRLMRHMGPDRFALAGTVVLGVTSAAFAAVGPRILGKATDIIYAGVVARLHHGRGAGIDFGALGVVLSWALAVYLVSAVFNGAQGRLLTRVVQRSMFRLRADVEAKVHRLSLSYCDGQPRGELLSRVTNDIDNIATTLQQCLSQLLTSLLTVLGALVLMLTISPLLTLVALAVLPISLFVTRRIAKHSQRMFASQWKHTGALNAHVEEAISGHQLVEVFGCQRETEAEFRRRNDELFGSALGAQFMSGLVQPAMVFLTNLTYVMVAVVGALQITSGALSLGGLQAFIQYSRQFGLPQTQISSMVNLLQSGVASAERVFDVLDADEEEPDPVQPAPLPARRLGKVEFEDVSFSYQADQPLIEHLALIAEPGQTVAIVGPTGAGKTTLVNLIMRFYELDGGRITLDGVDISQLRREDLRLQTGMVLQDTWLFGGTIRDNIAYGRPGATEEEIVSAAKATYVDQFVRSLPDGYDTRIDEEGTNISAGEKQMLTIARAFLMNPSLLILDEATSSVDTRTDSLIHHAMAALRSSRTSFVIAHRLSTIRDADLIVVMESGRIVEQGTHDELVASRGAYHRLWSAQFATV
jgi:ATP-binding cassette subfamily B protein